MKLKAVSRALALAEIAHEVQISPYPQVEDDEIRINDRLTVQVNQDGLYASLTEAHDDGTLTMWPVRRTPLALLADIEKASR